ncbi:MAG: chloramphenicol phosphotransferase CPT family protein [Defluviitaleaceae bacterium]|nr:chloramphenicol phosphotransferase CPT family protein [Defluviitaleaceae bacterium]
MKTGKIIYLNGISGAGKTTLAKKLQEQASEPFYWLSLDIFCQTLSPKKFLRGYDAFTSLLNTAKFYSSIGVNSIIDTVHIQKDTYEKGGLFHAALQLLNDCPVLFVHVTCPPDELRRRKTERGDYDADNQLSF